MRDKRNIVELLAPVSSFDPCVALELGLNPSVHAFVGTLADKDAATRAHAIRVAELAMRVGERGSLGPERLRNVGLGALLHDIGKIEIPDSILHCPGELTREAWQVMRTHAAIGAGLVHATASLTEVATVVRWHHERHDGSGYPDGLCGDEIPLDVAIISAADAWDAITWDRPYQAASGYEEACRILADGSGSQWNPHAVALLLDVVADRAMLGLPDTDGTFERVGASGTGAHVPLCRDALESTERGAHTHGYAQTP